MERREEERREEMEEMVCRSRAELLISVLTAPILPLLPLQVACDEPRLGRLP